MTCFSQFVGAQYSFLQNNFFQHSFYSFSFQGDDDPQKFLALDTISHICQSPKKKIDLFNRQGVMDLVLLPLQQFISKGTTEQKVRALEVLAGLIRSHDASIADDECREEMEVNAKCLYAYDRRPLDRLTELAKTPFMEISARAYR